MCPFTPLIRSSVLTCNYGAQGQPGAPGAAGASWCGNYPTQAGLMLLLVISSNQN